MKFDYRTQYYFPAHVVTLGHAAIFLGMVLVMMVHWLPGTVVILVGLFTVSLNYGLVVDCGKKKYKSYLFCFGLKIGKEKSFSKIEYLYLTSSQVNTAGYVRAESSDLTHMEFTGYIKFSEDEKISVVSSKRKRKVLIFLERMADDLDQKIVDLSKS